MVGYTTHWKFNRTKNYIGLNVNPLQKIALMKFLLAIAQAAYTPNDDDAWAQLKPSGMAEKCLEYLKIWHHRFWLYSSDQPFLQMPKIAASEIYDLCLMSELPQSKKPEKGKIYLTKQGNKLKYTVLSPKGKVIEGKKLGIPVQGELTKEFLNKNKSEILEITSKRGHTFGKRNIKGMFPETAANNTTVLRESQAEKLLTLTDADKALLIITLMGCALGGKKTENRVILSDGYIKKASSRPGTSIGSEGFMHTFLLGECLLQSIWLNILTAENIRDMRYRNELGTAPWEKMPEGEDCCIARSLKDSYMGRLIPLSRFCLLFKDEDELYCSEGLSHAEMVFDPSVTVIKYRDSKPAIIFVDPEKKPWRELSAMLKLVPQQGGNQHTGCCQLRFAFEKIRNMKQDIKEVRIWSGGLKVENQSGEQYVSGRNDFVDSTIRLKSECFDKISYEEFAKEMKDLKEMSDKLDQAIKNFFKDFFKGQNDKSKPALHLFWQLCEMQFSNLLDACKDKDNNSPKIRKIFSGFAKEVYDKFCPRDTARQLDAWAKSRKKLILDLSKFTGKENA